MSTRRAAVLALAMLFDHILGDPPNRYHPVAWMGSAIGAAARRAPRQGSARQFAYGALLAAGGASVVALLGQLLAAVFQRLPALLGVPLEAAALKTTFAWRGLQRAAADVQAALPDDLPEARRRLSWHLVSRDTSQLTASQVAAAAVESVAENASDGIVAPMLYYAAGGLPAALAYRFVNTGDAMLGYHDEQREWLGKAPARLDDVANLLPARLTALAIVAGAAWSGASADGARRAWQRDGAATQSPNAGHPMSAMAGALGVELEKTGCYRLNAGGRVADETDIARSLRIMNRAALLAGGALVGASLLAGLARRRQQR